MNAKGRFFWTERGEIIFAGEDVSTGNECAVSVELPLRTVVLFTSGLGGVLKTASSATHN